MKHRTKNTTGFTLVELLVVITILSIISVVAYQNFGGAIDKAVSGRKISDVSTIETSLQQYKVDKNHYPAVDVINATTNVWWYDSSSPANASNTLAVTYNGSEIATVTAAAGWGTIYNTKATPQQIWAKWTISQATLTKQYLTKDLYDPSFEDVKVGASATLMDQWIGRYVYAVYKKPTGTSWGAANNKTGSYYNIAYTIKKDGTDIYSTKIVWDYDAESCFWDAATCPDTLIGPDTDNTLVDEQEQWKNNTWGDLSNFGSSQTNQGIPYSITDFEG